MDLQELIVDINYQQKYDYEKRVDLFNKYQISPSSKFFVPIWELGQFIISNNMPNKNSFVFSFGHGQNILNNSLDRDVADKKELRIGLTSTGKSIMIRRYIADAKSIPTFGKYRNAIRFDLNTKTISLCSGLTEFGSYQVARDLYQKIDEWLVDFGYETW